MSDTVNRLGVERTQVFPGVEGRAWTRYRCAPGTCGLVAESPDRPPRKAEVQDLSVGSISFWMDEPAPVRTVVRVEMQGWEGPRSLLARVVHATPEGGRWLHGGELVMPLSVPELGELLAGE